MRARLIAIIGVCTIACATAEDVDGTLGNTSDSGLGTGGISGSTGFGSSSSGGSGGGLPSGGSGGGFPTGGTAGAGIGGGGGGFPGGTGGTGTGGAATGGTGGSSCSAGQKFCGGVCVQPNPGIGCSTVNPTDCTACPQPPANSTWFCNNGTCDFTCTAGYVKQGQTCISTGSGGTSSGGGGGTGGAPTCTAPCDSSQGESQFVCFAFCTFSGSPGFCIGNCCQCF